MTAARMAFFFAAYFSVAGVGMSYWPVWLQDRGVGPAEIGTIYMGRQMVTVLAILAVGWVAGRLLGVRSLAVALASAAVLIAVSYELAWGFWPNLLITLVWGMVWHPILSLGEGVCVTLTRQKGIDYGRVRVWGSVSFIVGAVAAGLSVEHWGARWVLYVMCVGVALTLPAVLWLPRPAAETVSGRGPADRPTAIDLLRRQPFVLFLLATGCCQASHAALSLFATLHWRAAGITDATISLLWAEAVVVEIVLFTAGGVLMRRVGAAGLIGLGALAGVVRWAAMPYITDVAALAVLQALHALTFGACHLGAMAFLQRALGAAQMAAGQSLYYGLASGLLTALMYQCVGWLYARVGVETYLAMSALSAAGLLLAWQLARSWNGALILPARAG
jgi:PPP family 3-phenylpropionic acid transporter